MDSNPFNKRKLFDFDYKRHLLDPSQKLLCQSVSLSSVFISLISTRLKRKIWIDLETNRQFHTRRNITVVLFQTHKCEILVKYIYRCMCSMCIFIFVWWLIFARRSKFHVRRLSTRVVIGRYVRHENSEFASDAVLYSWFLPLSQNKRYSKWKHVFLYTV